MDRILTVIVWDKDKSCQIVVGCVIIIRDIGVTTPIKSGIGIRKTTPQTELEIHAAYIGDIGEVEFETGPIELHIDNMTERRLRRIVFP